MAGKLTDSASDTRNVTTQERHPRLRESAVLILRLAELPVDLIDRGLERRELDHGVGDLTRPERVQALIEPAEALLLDDLAPPFTQRVREWR